MDSIFSPFRALGLLLVAGFFGCSRDSALEMPSDSLADSERSVTLFVAASTMDAVDKIVERFQQEHGITVETNAAGSPTLAQQIFHGAEADVFVSANEQWADYLEENALVAERRDLLENRLVVITPADSKLDVEKIEDLLGDRIKHLALADPDSVPAGIYAKEALTKLGLWQRLEAKVVAAGDVRQALAYVETGQAEAGIVYATDAAVSNSVKVTVRIDPELTAPIRYPIVLLKTGADNRAAETLYRYLNSPQAMEVFRKHSFTVIDDTAESGP